jgi:hypothetical protein
MRTIKAPPPDLATVLFGLGPRILVLVEGESDQWVFNEWYRDRLGDVMFHSPGGGVTGVQNRLQEALAQGHRKRVYGIIDRDFRSGDEVSRRLADPDEHLFVLHRYAIENYLLEPEALHEELRLYYGNDYMVPDVATILIELLRLCRQLRTRMAAHWIFFETGSIEYFPLGHDVLERDALMSLTAAKLGCSVEVAELRIAEKENLLDPLLTTLATAHTCVNGKHLLHQIYISYISGVRRGSPKDHLFNLLVRTIKANGLHEDIKEIVETRILRNKGEAFHE